MATAGTAQQAYSAVSANSSELVGGLKEINFATVNVRYDVHASNPIPVPRDGAIPPNNTANPWVELPWAERRSRLIDALDSGGHLDVIGFQEVLHGQLLDLSTLLGAPYTHVGVGRDDGREAGEYAPIFYDESRWERVDWTTRWLSDTPDVPGSKGWDASQTRIATYLTLRHRTTADVLHVANTHYDDRGVRARAQSSAFIRQDLLRWVERQEAALLAQGGGSGEKTREAGVVLLGDFNSPPSEDGYKTAISPSPLPSPSFYFLDSFTCLSCRSSSSSSSSSPTSAAAQRWSRQSAPYGPVGTYTTFGAPESAREQRIDFVFVAAAQQAGASAGVGAGAGDKVGRGGWVVGRYACVDNHFEGGDVSGWKGRWSDHRAVRVSLERA